MNLFCDSCKHFIGCGDFNLCCDMKYELYYPTTIACKDYDPIISDEWYTLVPKSDKCKCVCCIDSMFFAVNKLQATFDNMILFKTEKGIQQYIKECNIPFDVTYEKTIINSKCFKPTA